ncbi:uncharacterized protein BJX67DRAFT_386449 [Aspergillus lucknowensis]|uniref:Uncharacterized protein n=1 Tax=Aspergillus lucknowensis TaxID=176173 RepID=A0ABR4L643_9EURO
MEASFGDLVLPQARVSRTRPVHAANSQTRARGPGQLGSNGVAFMESKIINVVYCDSSVDL